MKRILSLFLLTAAVLSTAAQDRVNTYTARLRVPDLGTGASITVGNDSDVASGLRVAPKKDKTVGYRICIFFDNNQNGRSLANDALATFKSRFPGIPGEVIYANPTFKTMVGYCLDMNEASMLLGRTRDVFPSAVIVREENMPLAEFIRSSAEALPADGSEVSLLSDEMNF